jgi:pyruvate dehydrogenase E2 component (dihydrolipoamide acetyltransferase)
VTDFKLPELGESVTSGDVLRVLIKPGDTIAKEQTVLELETDKATIEVPSSVAGRVADVKVKAGDKVKVGQVIFSTDGDAGDSASAGAAEKAPAKAAAPAPAPAPAPAAPATKTKAPEPEKASAAPAPVAQKVVDINRGARAAVDQPASDMPVAPAAPSVRRMARELGVDIDQVGGSGNDGRISVDDVKAHAKDLIASRASGGGPGGGAGGANAEPLPDFSRWGEVERQAMRPVRRKTAEHLSAAWSAIPHVTQHDLADVTALEDLRKRYSKQVEAAGGALTVTAIAVKIVATAMKHFPQFNTSIDLAADEIVYKKYVNIGVAVDTDRGLLVPVIRGADSKTITEISVELSELAEKARTRKLSLDEMQGGTFSVSNLGGIGGTSFTPIVNLPEVAILGISRARMEPVYQKDAQPGGFVPRLMLPLSLSYDHRVVDGADGARFLRWVVDAFEQPFVLTL